MGYLYSYLLGDAVLLVVWLVLFLWRKDVRKEMSVVSCVFGFAGLISQFIYMNDWWHPQYITNTPVGIEDFIFGFVTGGIASVIYEEVFKKKIRIRKTSKKKEMQEDVRFFFFGSLLALIFFTGVYSLKLGSFYSSILAFTIPTGYMWFKRKDLIFDSLASGFLLMLVSFLAFIVPERITPGWVQSAWYMENFSGIIILNAPIEDVIWFFLAGAFIGPLYEFWKEGKLVKER